MIKDVADIPRRLREEKKDAERASDRKRKRRTQVDAALTAGISEFQAPIGTS